MARRDRHMSVALGTRSLSKDLGKAGLGGSLFARIVGGGDDQLTNDLARAHDAFVGDTAPMSVTQQVGASLGDARRIGCDGGPACENEERSGCDNRHRTHWQAPLWCLPVEHR